MRHNNILRGPRLSGLSGAVLGMALLGIAAASLLQASDSAAGRVPSLVAWTADTVTAASKGDAFRGMLLAKHCEHCHGAEGFSAAAATPNLAAMDRLALWKQLEDFQTRKRISRPMNPIAAALSARDVADVAAFYAAVPVFADPEDNRVFPQAVPDSARVAMASRLAAFGDGERGIPPCQACHGPVAYRVGVPSLATQNGGYVLNQLEAFASGTRNNDINEPMRTIAGLLTDEERHALADYYGAGFGLEPGGARGGK